MHMMDRPSGPRPPLSFSPTSTSTSSTLVGTPTLEYDQEKTPISPSKLVKPSHARAPSHDEVESFLHGGRGHGHSDSHSHDEYDDDGDGDGSSSSSSSAGVNSLSYVRRRWTTFSLAVLGVLFMSSCGGGVLSGLLFAGIGEVDGLVGQWVAQGLVGVASLTSLLHITLHIRCSLIGYLLYTPSPVSYPGFQHTLHAQATLTIRASLLLWISALPAISMGIFHGGRTIVKLDLFISICGLLCTCFLIFLVERVDEPFELPFLTKCPRYLPSRDLENAALRGGGRGRRNRQGKNKKTKRGKGSSFSGSSSGSSSSASSFSWAASSGSGSGSGETTPASSPRKPAPVYTLNGPRPRPTCGRNGGGRVLTRLSVINAAITPPAHHAVSPPTPPPQTQPAQSTSTSPSPSPVGTAVSTASHVASAAASVATEKLLKPVAAGVANTVSGWIWGSGGNKPGPGQQNQQQAPPAHTATQNQSQGVNGHYVHQGHGVDDMPGTYLGDGHRW